MEEREKLSFVQDAYAGVLADSVRHLALAGVLEEVTRRKKAEQEAGGPRMAARLKAATPGEVFQNVSKAFACADWETEEREGEWIATAKRCKLCALAKQLSTESPCRIYCLNPLEGMVRAVKPGASFAVESTRWEGEDCRVRVS